MLNYFWLTGRLLLTDDTVVGQPVLLDTDDAFLCVKPSDVEIGSVSVPARTASSQGADGTQTVVDIEKDYYCATLEIPNPRIVRGMMRITWDSNPEPADNLWRQASGTHLDILDGVSQTAIPQSDISGYARVATMGGYTFFLNDLNHLVLRERIVARARDPGNPGTTYNRARRAATVSYRLLCGFFLKDDFTLKSGTDYRAYVAWNNVFSGTMSHDFGYPFTGRRVGVIVHGFQGILPSSVVIGGLTATRDAYHVNGSAVVAIYSVVIPTGTNLTIVVNGYPNGHWFGVQSFVVLPRAGTITPYTGTQSGNSISTDVNLGATEALVAGATSKTTPFTSPGDSDDDYPVCAWTNAEATGAGTVSANYGTLRAEMVAAAKVRAGAGEITVSASWGTTGTLALVAVKYG